MGSIDQPLIGDPSPFQRALSRPKGRVMFRGGSLRWSVRPIDFWQVTSCRHPRHCYVCSRDSPFRFAEVSSDPQSSVLAFSTGVQPTVANDSFLIVFPDPGAACAAPESGPYKSDSILIVFPDPGAACAAPESGPYKSDSMFNVLSHSDRGFTDTDHSSQARCSCALPSDCSSG